MTSKLIAVSARKSSAAGKSHPSLLELIDAYAEARVPQDGVPAPVQSGLVATMLDALRHAQKVLNHNNLHLEAAFAPAQPAAEASRFGGLALQAMIIARCVEKDQADSVQDEALIRQMLEALETCNDGDGYNGPYQYYETVPVEEAVAAARARLLEADLAKLTERGAVAWPGIDAQDLRDGSKP